MNPSAIQSAHLNRLAVVYVRQSTPLQVEHHPESRLRQYQLTDRAKSFGWPAQRCLVIDDDLGISGAQSSNRPGYQRLVSMLALREVGIVFGLEVPTFFRLKKDSKSNVIVKHCPLNRTVRVEWENDAANDYFERMDSPGELIIRPGDLCEHWRLWNGEFTARFRAPEGPDTYDATWSAWRIGSPSALTRPRPVLRAALVLPTRRPR